MRDWAENLAKVKVRNIYKRDFSFTPLPGEIGYELRLLVNSERTQSAILYDGVKVANLMATLIPKKERNLRFLHIVFSRRFFLSYDDGDKRYHGRVITFGFPVLISTTGIVEAPAKPKIFYELKQRFGEEIAWKTLEENYPNQYLVYDDPRLTEVLKGYVLQAIFYHLTGNPFCENLDCRLYNSHWQEEVIRTQILSGKICDRHKKILEEWK